MNKYLFVFFILISNIFICSCKTVDKRKKLDSYSFEKISWNSLSISENSETMNTLKASIEYNLKWLNQKKSDSIFKLQNISFTTKDFICTSNYLINDIKNNQEIKSLLEKYFDLYKIKIENNKQVLYTGYYIPYVEASETKNSQFKVPIYKVPEDLITVNLEDFNPDFKGKIIRGRLDKNRLVPYWSREEIVDGKKLNQKKLEIAWVKNKTDLFFIEIQGSGLLNYPDGTKKFIHYAAQNGREYKSIGTLLLNEGSLQKDDISMQTIRTWLEKHPKEEQRILNYNKSFVFFNLEHDGPFGNINVKLTPERSIAADQRVFPAGTLTLLNFEIPEVSKNNKKVFVKENNKEMFSQLAFVQDTGGAIKGPTRVDVFWGEGIRAGEIAGVTKQLGELYVLVPKTGCENNLITLNSRIHRNTSNDIFKNIEVTSRFYRFEEKKNIYNKLREK